MRLVLALTSLLTGATTARFSSSATSTADDGGETLADINRVVAASLLEDKNKNKGIVDGHRRPTNASSPFAKVKESETYKNLKIRVEPNKLRNSSDAASASAATATATSASAVDEDAAVVDVVEAAAITNVEDSKAEPEAVENESQLPKYQDQDEQAHQEEEATTTTIKNKNNKNLDHGRLAEPVVRSGVDVHQHQYSDQQQQYSDQQYDGVDQYADYHELDHDRARVLVDCAAICPGERPVIDPDIDFPYLISDCFKGSYCPQYDNGNDVPVSCFDTSSITNMDEAFLDLKTFDESLACWDVSKVTSMKSMFENAREFNQPINDWETGNVQSMDMMFTDAFSFHQGIGSWDVGSVTSMSLMFKSAYAFNKPLLKWNVENVIDMEGMFENTKEFNQAIDFRTNNSGPNSWNVGSVKTMEDMFKSAEKFNQPLGKWDVGNVSRMDGMFSGADNFNKPIQDWDVSKVKTMRSMFESTPTFSQELDPWDVSKVVSMYRMFDDAVLFNQCLGSWASKTPDTVDTDFMFNNAACPAGDDGETPDPEEGPWCQTEDQSCTVPDTPGDVCEDDTDFLAFKGKPNCKKAIKQKSKCSKRFKINADGDKVEGTELCPSFCVDACKPCEDVAGKNIKIEGKGNKKFNCKKIKKKKLCDKKIQGTDDKASSSCPIKCEVGCD